MSLECLQSFADRSPPVPTEAANGELGAHVELAITLLGPDGQVGGGQFSVSCWSVLCGPWSVVRGLWSVS